MIPKVIYTADLSETPDKQRLTALRHAWQTMHPEWDVVTLTLDTNSGGISDWRSIPVAVAEHILAKTYGWSLREIENLPPRKFQEHINICMVAVRLEKVRAHQESFMQAARSSMPTMGINAE